MTPRRWALTVISFLLAIGASVYIIRASWSHEGARISLPWWAHLACLTVALVEILTRSVKIRLSAAAVHIPLSLRAAARVSLGGDFGGAITPSRSGAEPARFLILREGGVGTADALVVLFLELFLEMISLAALVSVFAIFLGGSTGQMRGLAGMLAAYSAFVIGGGALGYVVARRVSDEPPQWALWLRLGGARWDAILRPLRHLRANISKLRDARWWVMASALGFSVLHILMRLAILPIVVYALGVRGPLGPFVMWPLAILYGSAAAPAPAGGGLIEVAFREALGGHIPARVLGAALLWWRVYTFYILLVCGALVAGGVVMRALRRNGTARAAEEEPATLGTVAP
jgi:uncharacterized membrane protein YbhN (UPF0104 family)